MNFLHLRSISLLLAVLLLSACGYTPSAKFSRSVLGDKVSTSIIVSAQDPENSVVIKDAVDEAVIRVFQTSLVDKKSSDTNLVIVMGTPLYTPVVYDQNGYIVGYRMSVSLVISVHKNSSVKKYNVRGNHDFRVAPNALVTDQQRFEAIDFSTRKAIRAFLAKVSSDGARSKK